MIMSFHTCVEQAVTPRSRNHVNSQFATFSSVSRELLTFFQIEFILTMGNDRHWTFDKFFLQRLYFRYFFRFGSIVSFNLEF